MANTKERIGATLRAYFGPFFAKNPQTPPEDGVNCLTLGRVLG
jgi:hypothetical protein